MHIQYHINDIDRELSRVNKPDASQHLQILLLIMGTKTIENPVY